MDGSFGGEIAPSAFEMIISSVSSSPNASCERLTEVSIDTSANAGKDIRNASALAARTQAEIRHFNFLLVFWCSGVLVFILILPILLHITLHTSSAVLITVLDFQNLLFLVLQRS